jgi:hypothetical protein
MLLISTSAIIFMSSSHFAVTAETVVPEEFIDIYTDTKHNTSRYDHQAGPLTWDIALANSSSEWAKQCRQSRESLNDILVGENIWMFPYFKPSATSISVAVDAWYREVKD